MPPPADPPPSAQMLREANALRQQGNGQKALELYTEIIARDPTIAEAHFGLGQLYMAALRFEAAERALSRAAELQPGVAEIWHAWGEALIRIHDPEHDRLKQAKALLGRSSLPTAAQARIGKHLAGKARPKRPDAGKVPPRDLQTVIALLNARKPGEAAALTRRLLKAHPNVAALHSMMGAALRDSGDSAAALSAFGRAIRIDPDYFEGHVNYGEALMACERLRPAIAPLERARSLFPASGAVLTLLGRAYSDLGMTEHAAAALDRAIRAEPKSKPALLLRARVAERGNDSGLTLELTARCLALGLKTGPVHLLQARGFSALGDTESALKSVDKAIALMPDDGDALGLRATILQSIGAFAEAETAFRDAFARAPANGTNYRVYGAAHKFTPDDPLIPRMQALFDQNTLKGRDRQQLGFALSKAMEDTGQHSQVFRYLDAAARQVREHYPYRIEQRRDEIDRMQAVFADFAHEQARLTAGTDFAPVFVTGMPRSGTTLVEQILSSHSTVTGAGELGYFPRGAYKMLLPPGGHRKLADISPTEVGALAEDYRAHVQALHPGAGRITDKSIQTWFVMGLVWLALPRARIVVVRRDPRDNLLSVYKNVFPEGTHLYSYDLRDLGQYYRMFVEMLDFWRAIRPEGFTELRYEDLIAAPEPETRRLLAACNLDWEDACLNFHRNTRKVDTLSVYQVRQPIYRSSVGAWRRYEKELRSLFDSLGDLAEPG